MSLGGGAPELQKALAGADDVVDRAREEFERGASAQPAEPRQELRRADEIERIEAPDRLEIAGHGELERARVAAEPLREQRLLEHFERHPRHLLRDLDDPALPLGREPLGRRRRDPVDRRREAADLARREQRRERAALGAPVLAVDGQEAPA